jgi:hypothetical protein
LTLQEIFSADISRSTHTRDTIEQPARRYLLFGLPTWLSLSAFADATLDGTRKDCLVELTTVPPLIIDDLGMRKLPHTAAEDLLEVIMRLYERASTLLTSNRRVDDWGKLLGDTGAVTALLDRLLHHAHVIKWGRRSWRTKVLTRLAHRGGDEVKDVFSQSPNASAARPKPLPCFVRRMACRRA